MTMATGITTNYDIPFPLSTDPVNVHGDMQSLAETVDAVLRDILKTYLSVGVRNNSGVNIAKGDPVYITGYSSDAGFATVAKCQSSDSATFPVLGLAQEAIGNNATSTVIISGVFDGINTGSYTAGDKLYVGATGGLTKVKPDNASVVAIVAKSNTSGIIIVGQPKGNGTWGSLKEGLA